MNETPFKKFFFLKHALHFLIFEKKFNSVEIEYNRKHLICEQRKLIQLELNTS